MSWRGAAYETKSRGQARPANAGPSRTRRPDEPISSIEDNSQQSEERDSVRSSTPSVSVNTPDGSETRFPNTSLQNPSSALPEQDDAENVSHRFQGLRLGTHSSPSSSQGLDLGSMRAALPSVESASPRQTPLLLAGGSPASFGGRRRRSSSVDIRPYNVRDEVPPQDRFHNSEFQRAFAHAKSLMGRLTEVLGSSTLPLEPDSVIRSLRDKAEELSHFRCPPTRTVGLVGDSGAGKSSLLNSLLDFHGLARTSNSGAACTCVVTEYRHHDSADFVVDVVVFTEDELQDQFRNMVHAYRYNYFHSADMESQEERLHWADQAKLASDTFKAMFGDRFTADLLCSVNSETRIVRTLLRWAVDSSPIRDIDKHAVKNSLEDCSELLMKLTSDHGAAHGPAHWPYIKNISVHLDSYIVSKGLVLVDLPGLRDLNSARRNITERYLLDCDEIFIICPIGRAVTDEGVMNVVERARQARLSNISIICTKSDQIRADEAQRDWRGAQAAEIQRRKDLLATAEGELAKIREPLDELNDLDDLFEEEEIQKARLYERLERKGAEIENIKFELQRYMITERNALVESELQALYRDKIPGGVLYVFCASNTLYWDKRNLRSRVRALPFLELSGIVAIRRHCMALVSESQLRAASKYLRDDIPNLLSNIKLWVRTGLESADAGRKQAVQKAISLFGDRLRTALVGNSSPLDDLSQALIDTFDDRVYQRRQIARWTEGAVQAGQVWSSVTTYAAFCRQYGTYTTAAVGYHCWNEEAMKTMNGDLAHPWDNLQEEVQRLLHNTRVAISETQDRVVSRYLDIALQDFPDSIHPLRNALKSRRRILVGDVEELGAAFEAEVSKLRTKALSGLRTSYFGESMELSYWKANCEHGPGSWARKKGIINGTLGNEQLFRELMRKFKCNFGELATQLDSDVLASVEEYLEDIENTLDMIRSENVVQESERDPEFKARVAHEADELEKAMEYGVKPVLRELGLD
ncbi:hypothetical protein C7999DRAFT_39705 [Corynascus novoguineensis]|uniref:Uncharacterized protein n=1 Tax=Corynascus novoguineensis TaxID=1126955 RepID=A0AAN7CWG4_9PEZI|nr:hypothetical protein C7999DRAFT_39705 [Corynascus novoguineensis]